MISEKNFHVVVCTKKNILQFQATSVEMETTTGQLVILPGHVPIIGLIAKGTEVSIREQSGTMTALSIPDGLFVLDSSSTLTIIKID